MRILVDEYILLCAFRYALGRKTYAVSEVAKELKLNWPNLSNIFKRQARYEIEQALHNDDAGMEMDKKEWKSILELKD